MVTPSTCSLTLSLTPKEHPHYPKLVEKYQKISNVAAAAMGILAVVTFVASISFQMHKFTLIVPLIFTCGTAAILYFSEEKVSNYAIKKIMEEMDLAKHITFHIDRTYTKKEQETLVKALKNKGKMDEFTLKMQQDQFASPEFLGNIFTVLNEKKVMKIHLPQHLIVGKSNDNFVVSGSPSKKLTPVKPDNGIYQLGQSVLILGRLEAREGNMEMSACIKATSAPGFTPILIDDEEGDLYHEHLLSMHVQEQE